MRSILIFVFLACIPGVLYAQPRDEKPTELSFSGCYQAYNDSRYNDNYGALLMSGRIGICLNPEFEFEPEFSCLISRGDPAYIINGNVCYNIVQAKPNIPFLLAGYGVSTSVPVFNDPLASLGRKMSVLNLGGGMKFYVSQDVAIRLEYRYQHFHAGVIPTTDAIYSDELNASIHSMQIGITILVPWVRQLTGG
jgi:hypothetical protein